MLYPYMPCHNMTPILATLQPPSLMSQLLATIMADPHTNPVTDSVEQTVSLLDYIFLFFDYLLILIAFHGQLTLMPFLLGIVSCQEVILIFALLLIPSAFSFIGGIFSSVHQWNGCVTLWHHCTLVSFCLEVFTASSMLFARYLDKGLCYFFNT